MYISTNNCYIVHVSWLNVHINDFVPVCVCVQQLRPENAEEFIEYLIRIGRLDEAAIKLADIVNDVSCSSHPTLSSSGMHIYMYVKMYTYAHVHAYMYCYGM